MICQDREACQIQALGRMEELRNVKDQMTYQDHGVRQNEAVVDHLSWAIGLDSLDRPEGQDDASKACEDTKSCGDSHGEVVRAAHRGMTAVLDEHEELHPTCAGSSIDEPRRPYCARSEYLPRSWNRCH